MTFTVTILQHNASYTFIWSPASERPASNQSLTGNSCWATIPLQAHQHAELTTALDSAAQVALYLRPLATGTPADQPFTNALAASASGTELEGALTRLGRLLFNYLLPPPLQKLIRELPPATPLLIRTNESELPWELLHDGEGFLSLRHAIARQMLFDDLPLLHNLQADQPSRPRTSAALRCLLVGNPNGNLPAAELEIENLLEIFDTAATPIHAEFLCREQATKMRVLNALASGEYHIIHFATHARAGAIGLADDWLSADEIQSTLRGHPMVFLNACNSGRSSSNTELSQTQLKGSFGGQQTYSLAHAFLMGGAAAFAGTFWPVDDTDARWLALEYYQSFLSGTTIAQALQHARNRSRSRSPLSGAWSAPLLYGDPTYRLRRLDSRPQPATLLAVRLFMGDEQRTPGSPDNQGMRPGTRAGDDRTEQLRRFFAHALSIITAHGGQFVSHSPRQIYAIFGVSTPLEDDAVRAIRAGLEIGRISQTEAIPVQLAVASGKITPVTLEQYDHTAVTSGSGDLASQMPIPLFLGGVFDEAERLLAVGQPMQLLANTQARRLSEGRFIFVPSEMEQAGDEPGEPDAYLVSSLPTPAAVVREAVPTTLLQQGQLLGRSRESSLLATYWQSASQGRGLVVGIVGEAGIGKTRLLQDFCNTLVPAAHRQITLACTSTDQERPYMLVGQLLHHIFDIDLTQGSEAIEGQVASLLKELPGIETSDDRQLGQILRETLGFTASELPQEERKARRGRLVHLLRTLMAGAARQGPLLIAIDDIQWIDEASLEILTQVTDGINRLPVQLILLYRPDWQHSWFDKPYYRHLHLDQLDEPASIELICMLLQSATLPKGLTLLLHKTGGNPFFITEMIKSLQETGVLVRQTLPHDATGHAEAGEWELQRPLTEQLLPDTVERVLRVRLERLPAPARRLLEIASVIGPLFRLDLLQKLVSEAEQSLDALLAELEQRGFVEARWDVQEYRFCHALIRDTVYQSLPGNQRMAWHRRVAELLELTLPPDQRAGAEGVTTTVEANAIGAAYGEIETLAHHYYQSVLSSRMGEAPKFDPAAHPQQIARGCFYLAQAGKRAQARHAAREALNYYQRAWSLYLLTTAHIVTETEIHEGIGDASTTLGDFDAADRALRQAYAALHTQPLRYADHCRAADLARRIGRLCAWRGEHELALEWMRQGLRHVTELPSQATGEQEANQTDLARAIAALIHVHIGSVEYNRGNLAEAAAECERGLAFAPTAGTPALPAQAEGYNLLGIMAWARGDFPNALQHLSHSRQLWEELGNRYQAARVDCNIGVVHFHMANWSTARTHYLRCLDYWQQIEDQDMFALTSLNLGNIHLYRGEWSLAERMLEQAMAVWQRVQNQRWLGLCHTNLGLLYMEQGEWAKSQLHLEESRELLTHHHIRDLLPEALAALAEVQLEMGQPEEALLLAQEAHDLAVELDMRQEEAFALRALGKGLAAQGTYEQAVSCMEQSQCIYEELGNRYEVGRTLYQYVRLTIQHAGAAAYVQANAPANSEPTSSLDHLHQKLQQAVSLFTELGADHDLHKAQALLQTLTTTSPSLPSV